LVEKKPHWQKNQMNPIPQPSCQGLHNPKKK
jgi:hypothetical protein